MGNVNATTETNAARSTGDDRLGAQSRLTGVELVLHDRRAFSGEEAWSADRAGSEAERLSPELIERITRLEAAMGATLSLLRRCIVEHMTPTREDLAAEAGYVFETSREAAMAELDEVAQMVGVSSIR